MTINLEYRPTEKQKIFHSTKADEVLFGGAAGGGKSFAIIMDAIDLCLRHKGISAYVFRKSYKELEDTLIPIVRQKVPKTLGEYKGASHEFLFINGSVLRFRQLLNKDDKFKYQGAEINALYIDELTHFTKEEYDFLKSRLRANKALNFKPIIRCTSNPGGKGHAFVKEYFIDKAPYMQIYEEKVYSPILKQEKTMTRQYIPALVTDNPHISGEYIFELEKKPKALRDAFLLGKWDAFEGQVFMEWVDDFAHYKDRKFTHVISPFEIPKHYKKYRSFDFGYSRPFAVLWWAVGEEGEAYLYKEWYGASAPNVGIKLSPTQIAKGIKKMDMDDEIVCSFADPSIWDCSRGQSVAEQMEKAGVYFVPGDNQRLAGKMAIHERLRFDENGNCKLYVFNTCREFIRTFPALSYDKSRPEDIDTDLEDHIYDATRYFFMNKLNKAKRTKIKRKVFNPLSEDTVKKQSFL